MLSLIALSLLTKSHALQSDPLEAFALKVQDNLHLGQKSQLNALFDKPERDLPYIQEMGARSGGMKTLKVVILPAPPHWETWGDTWAVIHTFQDCEQDHDVVMEVLRTPTGYVLGREVPQWENGGAKVNHVYYQASVHPDQGKIDVETVLDVTPSPLGWAPIFRLNDIYKIQDADHGAKVVSGQSGVIHPAPDTDFVRAGGLLIPWKSIDKKKKFTFGKALYNGDDQKQVGQLTFTYTGNINTARDNKTSDQDVLTPRETCIASLWIPALGQLPAPVFATITGPMDWIIRGEGNPVGTALSNSAGTKTSFFDCPLPISFPKIIGGQYELAASSTIGGQEFKVFELPPLKRTEANVYLKRMTDAAAFYQANLAQLPFPGYELYVSDAYYGIESYSHTILAASAALEVSHELGHTYFGGMAPCTYVHDTWNEGVTQYIDSIALHHNDDKTLEGGLQTVGLQVPLTQLFVPWSYDNATYTRGAYVMHMLEAEITQKGVLDGLKALVADRVGKDTKWDDLRPYFEKVSGKDLGWFWTQWIDASVFPTLTISDLTTVTRDKKFRNLATIDQKGTKSPYQMRFKLVATVNGARVEAPVTMTDAQTIAWIDTDFKPTEVHLEVFPDTLATVNTKKSASGN